MDVVFSRQATDRGRGAEDRAKELGVVGPQAQFDHEQGGVQDLFDVSYCLLKQRWVSGLRREHGDWGEEARSSIGLSQLMQL